MLWSGFAVDTYRDKLAGSLLARFAGCTLGALVEGWTVDRMKSWAREIGDEFPPADYWSASPIALTDRYTTNKFKDYTRSEMNGVPADDDIIYTMLGLLLLEKYGIDFRTEDVLNFWQEHLYWVWTDMDYALKQHKIGKPVETLVDDSPFSQMICAGIRCDPYAYIAPGLPERAASLAYKDAYASHRRNGIYGGMFFAACISAAFAVNHPVEAIEIGLGEIPAECELADAVRWALSTGEKITSPDQAREAVDRRYQGMILPHTLNNACLTVFGLMLGGTDISRVISSTVAMGLDNDCTAATAGSIAGAVVGREMIPDHWIRPFNNKVHSYIKGHRFFYIDDVISRYTELARQSFTALANRNDF